MYKKTPAHYAAKIAVDILFYLGIAAMLTIPILAKMIRTGFGYNNSSLIPLMIILTLSGLCSIYILFNLKQMFKSLLNGNPFTEKNVSHFRKMAVASFLIALIYALKCIILPTFSTVIIIAVFAIASLFCLTLKDLFKQAIAFKEENELTV